MFELSPSSPNAGRRSFLDPEQLRLEQRFDHGRAIDRDERTTTPPTQLVDLASHEFLARPTFAFNQDREVSGSDPLHPRPQRLHDGRRSNQWRNRSGGPASRCHATARDFQDQSAELRDGRECIEVVFVKATCGIAGRFENRLHACIRCGNTEDDGVGRARGSDEPGLIPRAHFSQSH